MLDGLPERLLLERDDDPRVRLGEVRRGRVTAIERASRLAFVDLGTGEPGVLQLSGDASGLTEGAFLTVEVRSEAPQAGKGPVLKRLGPGDGGPPVLLRPAPSLAERLQAFAPDAAIVAGEAAREASDRAQDDALATAFDFPTGERLTIEPTRALVAVDLDWSPTAAAGARRTARANARGLAHAARLLRLKSLAGTIVVDLIGFGEGREAIAAAAKAAFAPDGARVLPVSPLGLLQVAKPRTEAPLALRLLEADGRPSARTCAQGLVRALEREGRADPGARLEAVCAPEVAAAMAPLVRELGPRFSVRVEVGRGREASDIRRR